MHRLDNLAEAIFVLGDIHDHRVDVADCARGTKRKQRQVAAVTQDGGMRVNDKTLGALFLRRFRAVAIRNFYEHRDSVAFCDCLAQPSCTRHGS